MLPHAALARAAGSTRLIASAPLPNASPWMFRAAVLVGVSVVVMPMTAIFTPFFVTSFQGVAHPRLERVDRPVELVIADRGGVDAHRVQRVDRAAPIVGVRQRGALHLVAGIEPHRRAAAGGRETVEPGLPSRT